LEKSTSEETPRLPTDDDAEIRQQAERLGVGWARPDLCEIGPEALACVSARLASHYEIVPVALEGETLRLATAAPENRERLAEIELVLARPIVPLLAKLDHVRRAIKKFYGVGAETIEKMRSQDDATLVIEQADHHSIDDETGDASIIRFVNQIISDAFRLSATDIHFEPEEHAFRIRYRVDGLLEEIPVPPRLKQFQAAIISRIKVMAQLDIAEQRLPQDGRIPVRLSGEAFDLRVSVLPTPLGEAVDLRLLRRANVQLGLEELGYSHANMALLETAAKNPHGIILVTGPTGSGKTTSLYAVLGRINAPDRKTITIEDPIEYHLPRMIQMQVHDEVGFTFARALRSILRHDPDIVLVGEIRDPETAQIAIRMAMTGHLVLSTLHTNDAASSIARLVDMGQEPYLLASTIICVVAQRLIRRICPRCKETYRPSPALLQPFQRAGLPMPAAFYRGAGCEACRKSGYADRTGIHEIIPLDDDFRDLIMSKAPASGFRELARKKGIKLMRDDAWDRVVAGQTTAEEIVRVTQSLEV
jgi:type II secretory ATPase GspE/PulE/Tfp pilus assembly ATPase PilB-like protein